MIDYKGRVESYSREMLRKESQIKELQTRMETGDGSEYQVIIIGISCPTHYSTPISDVGLTDISQNQSFLINICYWHIMSAPVTSTKNIIYFMLIH